MLALFLSVAGLCPCGPGCDCGPAGTCGCLVATAADVKPTCPDGRCDARAGCPCPSPDHEWGTFTDSHGVTSTGWRLTAAAKARIGVCDGHRLTTSPPIAPAVHHSHPFTFAPAVGGCSNGSCGVPAYPAYGFPVGGGCAGGQCGR